jgi:hypothetical protein
MSIEQLKSLANAKPFRVFTLETTAGSRITIDQVGHVQFPPADFKVIILFAADKLMHFITIDDINTYAVA